MKKRIILGAVFILFLFALNASVAKAYTQVGGADWAESIKKGKKLTWTIDKVDAAGATEWDWAFGNNVTFKQGEKIIVKWTEAPDGTGQVGMGGPLNYTGVTVTVGETELDQEDEKWLNFLTAPLYVNNTLGKTEALNYLERVWFNTFTFPDSAYSDQSTWNIIIENATIGNTGPYATKDDTIMGYIHDQGGEYPDDFDLFGDAPEAWIFDVIFAAASGVVTSLKYPSTIDLPNEFVGDKTYLANSTWSIVSGLDALEISLSSSVPGWAAAAPGFEASVLLTGLFVMAAIVVIRRRR